MSHRLAVAAFAGIALALAGYEIYGFILVHGLLGDYRAFWCAASVALHGADPYRAFPLSICEHSAVGLGLHSPPEGVVVPAPIPPYAIALFVPLTLLALPVSAVLWFVINTGAVAWSVQLMSRAIVIPPLLAGWCLLLPATILWLPYGELTPLALAGALTAAVGLQTARNAVTAGGLMLLALEPHLALPAWISVALFVPGTRVWLGAGGAVLLGISAILHPNALGEYIRFVLPLHALSEVPRPAQYSATWISYALGMAPNAAIAIGQASYAIFLIAGIWAARILRERWMQPATLVFVPLGAAVTGGVFVHASQVALALPLAALFATRERGQLRVLGTIARCFSGSVGYATAGCRSKRHRGGGRDLCGDGKSLPRTTSCVRGGRVDADANLHPAAGPANQTCRAVSGDAVFRRTGFGFVGALYLARAVYGLRRIVADESAGVVCVIAAGMRYGRDREERDGTDRQRRPSANRAIAAERAQERACYQ